MEDPAVQSVLRQTLTLVRACPYPLELLILYYRVALTSMFSFSDVSLSFVSLLDLFQYSQSCLPFFIQIVTFFTTVISA